MTLRTVTTALDPLTLTEWRSTLAAWIGETYSGLAATAKTELNRYIDEAHEYITERWGHEPWTQREASLSLASDVAVLALAVDVRQVILITEVYNSDTRVADLTTKRDWMMAWGTGGFTSHPWSTQEEPHWFFDGMDDSNPPKQQWKRVPTPDAAVTGTVLFHPYFTLLTGSGDAQYSELPPHAVAPLRETIRLKWARFTRDTEGIQLATQAREDELAAVDVADNPKEGHEGPITIDLPNVFKSEMTA